MVNRPSFFFLNLNDLKDMNYYLERKANHIFYAVAVQFKFCYFAIKSLCRTLLLMEIDLIWT